MREQWTGFPGGSVREVGRLQVFSAPGPAWRRQIRAVWSDLDLTDLQAALQLVPDATVSLVDGTVEVAALKALGRVPTGLLRMEAPVRHVPSPLRVEVVGPDSAAVVEAVAQEGFGLDLPGWFAAPLGRSGWTQVLAFDGERPVATAGLHVAGACGWIGAAATLPDARGRGAHRSLLAARLSLAAAQGAERLCVKVTRGTASHRNLLAAGFVEAYGVTDWVPA